MIVIHPDSSSVKHFIYDEKLERAVVSFHSGRAYTYEDVSKELVAELILADSFGSTFNKLFVGKNNQVGAVKEMISIDGNT